MDKEERNEAAEFWKEKETAYGGELRYRSFARYLGSTAAGSRELSGLLFLVNDLLVFEDFEREAGMFGFLVKKKKTAYQKTVLEMSAPEIREIRQIAQGTASARMAGAPGPSKPLSGFMKFFSVVVYELNMNNGDSFYFEILDKGSLIQALEK